MCPMKKKDRKRFDNQEGKTEEQNHLDIMFVSVFLKAPPDISLLKEAVVGIEFKSPV